MSSADGRPAAGPPPYLPVLLALFVGSGCAALIYEVVWFQLLQLVIGATGVSLGVLLATFMGGMFLGSLALPRYVSRGADPLRVYAALEVGIAVIGVALIVLVPALSAAYVRVAPPGLSSVPFRALLAALLLLPPTVLMGATLPAVSRYVETTPAGVAWMGFFYGGNLAGAVLGCLLAGFYLLRVHDTVVATLVAAGLNVGVAGLAWLVARRARAGGAAVEVRSSTAAPGVPLVDWRGRRAVLVAIGLSGLTALGAEVVWTRLMALTLGATTYTFSILLAVFLAALGVGSALGAHLSRTISSPRTAFALCQLGAAMGIAWTAYAVSSQLPYWPIDPSIALRPAHVFQLDVARALWALVPAPFFWGASFPLAVAAAAERGQDPGVLVGGVYAANTVGAIAGALAFGVWVIPALGTQNAQRVLVGLAAASSAVLAWSVLGEALRSGASRRMAAAGWALAAVVAAALLARSVGHVPAVLVAYGRYAATYEPPRALYVGEGRNSSIAVTELGDGTRNFHVGGKVVASTEPQDMRIQGMIGHLAGLLHEGPRSVLVVGFGAGVTAGTFVTYPTVERIVICEIEPLITEDTPGYFVEVNNDVVSDPRVEIVHDDARHYLLTTDETFDIVTSDPIHPWMKGAAALYSVEYFELVKEHLNPGGVVTQWVPLYESTTEAVKSELATFFQAFGGGSVWANRHEGAGYDVVLAAREGGLSIDLERFVDRLQSGEHSWVAESLGQVGFSRVLDILGTYAASAEDLEPWLVDAELNRDRNLRLMYLAGLGLNRYREAEILREIVEYRTFPERVFLGEPERVAALRRAMGMR